VLILVLDLVLMGHLQASERDAMRRAAPRRTPQHARRARTSTWP
jgi:hypothetical protein